MTNFSVGENNNEWIILLLDMVSFLQIRLKEMCSMSSNLEQDFLVGLFSMLFIMQMVHVKNVVTALAWGLIWAIMLGEREY